jgi:hypothetical protein
MPRIPKAQIIIVPVPPLNSRRRNIFRSTIGWAERDSMTRKAPAKIAASANAPRMRGEVQPLSLPWIRA